MDAIKRIGWGGMRGSACQLSGRSRNKDHRSSSSGSGGSSSDQLTAATVGAGLLFASRALVPGPAATGPVAAAAVAVTIRRA